MKMGLNRSLCRVNRGFELIGFASAGFFCDKKQCIISQMSRKTVSCNEWAYFQFKAKNYEFHYLDLFFIRNQFLFLKIDKEQNV